MISQILQTGLAVSYCLMLETKRDGHHARSVQDRAAVRQPRTGIRLQQGTIDCGPSHRAAIVQLGRVTTSHRCQIGKFARFWMAQLTKQPSYKWREFE
jgi:hypothetical protein